MPRCAWLARRSRATSGGELASSTLPGSSSPAASAARRSSVVGDVGVLDPSKGVVLEEGAAAFLACNSSSKVSNWLTWSGASVDPMRPPTRSIRLLASRTR